MLSRAFTIAGWILVGIFALALSRANHIEQATPVVPEHPPAVFQPLHYIGPTSIEEIGDSITYGVDESMPLNQSLNYGHGGYRKIIWPWLHSHGYKTVGSVIAGDTPDWDWHCEGRPGATTADLAARFLIFDQGIHPDVVLLMIGTNDFDARIPLEQSMTNMAVLWSEIYKQNPQCDLYVSSILPLRGYNVEQGYAGHDHGSAETMNALINKQVKVWKSKGYSIHFVDMYHLADLDAAKDFGPSGIHPTQSGYAKMARVWILALADRNKTKS